LAEQQQRQADKLARLAAMELKLAEKMSAKGLETWKERPILGVYENTSVNAKGLAIESLVKGKGAEAAGLMPGDVVVQVDGKAVTGSATLRNALDGRKAGDQVTVVFVRNEKTLRTTLTLSSDRQPVVQKIERDPCKVFIGVYTSGTALDGRGMRVQGVIDDTPAKIGGVQPGDVILAFNGVPVSNHQQLVGERDKNKPGDAFRLTILRDDKEMTVKARFKACDEADNKLTQETVQVLEEDAAAERGLAQGELALNVFEAYPSPTLGPLNVRFEAEALPTTVRVLDLMGREVFRRELPQFSGYFNEEINLANNKAGNYILSVQQGNQISSKQVVLLPRA
jgi:predicted metalloprotease with PDZ domain